MSRISSLRARLLVGIMVPALTLIALDGISVYSTALAAANTAYDRTLLASAKVIGEQLDVDGYDAQARLRATVPYSALEAFEVDSRSRMVYRVSGPDGEMVSGYAGLPFWRGKLPEHTRYAALVHFYDDIFDGKAVRAAVLMQPVSSATGRGMAVVQVAETLELRETLARELLLHTLSRQALLIGVVALVVVIVVQVTTRPVRRLSAELDARAENDLTPLPVGDAPKELVPLVDATNHVMARLQHLLDNQKRFVRDSAHQLRTPLAVLKTQVQSALRGDVEPTQALREVNETVDRATVLANQMLSLAKIEQLRHQPAAEVCDFTEEVRTVALDLAPLVADKDIDFEIETEPTRVLANPWMLRELSRNILHNAIRHVPSYGQLKVRVAADADAAVLTVADSGPGLSAEMQSRLFQPFSPGGPRGGSGLGLTISHEIVTTLGGTIALKNRMAGERVEGLDVVVRLPMVRGGV
ncbi:sensor histidine kinase [Ramlibacter sp. PS4R-6]|uniref:sensor histidine kinase n=1 Tax=Ramlibacter sp. PS4R-6 TaxID=3133438 RepID=UPI0030A5FC9D